MNENRFRATYSARRILTSDCQQPSSQSTVLNWQVKFTTTGNKISEDSLSNCQNLIYNVLLPVQRSKPLHSGKEKKLWVESHVR